MIDITLTAIFSNKNDPMTINIKICNHCRIITVCLTCSIFSIKEIVKQFLLMIVEIRENYKLVVKLNVVFLFIY